MGQRKWSATFSNGSTQMVRHFFKWVNANASFKKLHILTIIHSSRSLANSFKYRSQQPDTFKSCFSRPVLLFPQIFFALRLMWSPTIILESESLDDPRPLYGWIRHYDSFKPEDNCHKNED
ncbi:hypothetical protein L3Y34_016451 [Caenorhabditis briggsae]|uniref:Uncharacterized protein n=1 Tax=Caenorhabditis briggsae TaxID=6238 RepID=A0AAE9DZD5_CAEBR|nr:hypothetical protein L3Y34_016451 [Caenorhabditis briggsae]